MTDGRLLGIARLFDSRGAGAGAGFTAPIRSRSCRDVGTTSADVFVAVSTVFSGLSDACCLRSASDILLTTTFFPDEIELVSELFERGVRGNAGSLSCFPSALAPFWKAARDARKDAFLLSLAEPSLCRVSLPSSLASIVTFAGFTGRVRATLGFTSGEKSDAHSSSPTSAE